MRRLAAAPIHLYRWTLGPIFGRQCRYHPTCSAYALEAIGNHGIVKGYGLALRRILRCHPWGDSGFDPVPGKAGRK